MKSIFLITGLLLAFLSTKAQGMQFSQVLLPLVTLNGATGSTASIGTVPAGKVWKLENYTTNDNYCVVMRLNGNTTNLIMPYSPTSNSGVMNGQSFWFPAGTQLALYRTCNNSPTIANYYFSILEFTVTP